MTIYENYEGLLETNKQLEKQLEAAQAELAEAQAEIERLRAKVVEGLIIIAKAVEEDDA